MNETSQRSTSLKPNLYDSISLFQDCIAKGYEEQKGKESYHGPITGDGGTKDLLKCSGTSGRDLGDLLFVDFVVN